MRLNRRTFLHQSTWGLLTLGMSQNGLSWKWDRHARSLAAATPVNWRYWWGSIIMVIVVISGFQP